jgi:FtsP/CotA-like multicopper oxidase with cupredoxin domain
MAGAIIMEDPPNSLPPQVQDMPEVVLVMTMINAADSSNDVMIGVWGQPALEKMAEGDLWTYPNGQQVNLGSQVVLINGQYKPSLAVQSGTWYRLRMVYGAVWSVTTARILSMHGGSCEMQMLAKDGIWLNEIPREISAAYFASGNRVDIAMRCTCMGKKTCSTAMASGDSVATPKVFEDGANKKFLKEGAQQADKNGPMSGVAQTVIQQVLMSINIAPGTDTQPDLPTFSVIRPCYLVDLTNVQVPSSNQGRLELMNPTQFEIKWAPSLTGGTAQGTPMLHMSQPAWTSLNVGEVYEYNFVGDPVNSGTGNWKEGTGLAIHPLHTHVNPYQVIEYTDASNKKDAFYQNGDWQDTLLWSGMTAKVKFITDFFVGHMIVHCHILGHEDQGMMGWFNITGTPGTRWSGAQQVDPSCYDDYGGAGYTLGSSGSSKKKLR